MATTVHITTEYMTLTQLLKDQNVIASGGQAKYFLADQPVMLNGIPENRRGKKLYAGDTVAVLGETFVIAQADPADVVAPVAPMIRVARATPKQRPKGPAAWNSKR